MRRGNARACLALAALLGICCTDRDDPEGGACGGDAALTDDGGGADGGGGTGDDCPEPAGGGDADTDADADVDGDADTDADADADADADTDSDTDADADADTDSETDADADADTDSDTDADTDADADADGDADADTDSDADTGSNSDTTGGADGVCLIISEYIHDGGNDKALELFNCGVGWLDPEAEGLSLCFVRNDDTDCTGDVPIDSLPVPPGGLIRVCNPQIDPLVYDPEICEVDSGFVAFNGDDRVLILDDGEVLDAFGDAAIRPAGEPFDDLTLRRCSPEPYPGDGSGPFVETDEEGGIVGGAWSTRYVVAAESGFDDFGVAPDLGGCP